MAKTGTFIVIDGTDGSGKATQVNLLVAALRAEGREVAVVDFPQYGQPSAWFVEQYLNGKFGTAQAVGPLRASYFYALDRYAAKTKMSEALAAGKILIGNRYVTSNMGHQGCKIASQAERRNFWRWLDKLEYEELGIPRPDQTIILHVPAKVAQRLVDKKGHRNYLGGQKRDIHEADLGHLQKAEAVYLELVEEFADFVLVECTAGDKLLTPAEIHAQVRKIIKI